MARLPVIGWRDAIRAFEKAGWVHDRTRGSHYVTVRLEQPGMLSIPMHDPIKRGTLRALIRDSGLSVDEFVTLLTSALHFCRLNVDRRSDLGFVLQRHWNSGKFPSRNVRSGRIT